MISVELKGVDDIIKGLSRMLNSVQPESLTMMERASSETADLMKSNIDSRSGSLASSIDYKVKSLGNTIESEIGPDDGEFGGRPVGRAVELGRSPGGGFPNWFDIAARYGVSTNVAFLMAKKIQQQGTQGLRFVEKTYGQILGIFNKYGVEVIYKIANRY